MRKTTYEKLKFTVKSILWIAFIGFACGAVGVILFAPELDEEVASGAGYNQPTYASPVFALGQKVLHVKWRETFDPDHLSKMVQGCAILSYTPEGIFITVVLYFMGRMEKGESLNAGNIGNDLLNSLPPDPNFQYANHA